MELKELRRSKNITQKQCAEYLGIPLRTYKRYESEEIKRDTVKYRFMVENLKRYGLVDENHGILSVDDIKNVCSQAFNNYGVEYCYLFGSYAKNRATEQSDVDLLVSTQITGLKFYGLLDALRVGLKKKIDLLTVSQLKNNSTLLDEILKDGIKIYG